MDITARKRVLGNPDMLSIVFRYLDPRSVKTVRRVSTLWRSVIEKPKFWTKMRLKVNDINFTEVLQSRTIKLVPLIVIIVSNDADDYDGDDDYDDDSDDYDDDAGTNSLRGRACVAENFEQFFRYVAAGELSQLKAVSFYGTGCWPYGCDLSLSSISPELISEAVVCLESCKMDLFHSKLPDGSIESILDKIIKTENLRLKSFRMGPDTKLYSLHGIPRDILMKAVVKLEETNIYWAIEEPEMPELLKFIAESQIMKLKDLRIHINFQPCNVTPDDLAAALVRVQEVKLTLLRTTYLTPDHLQRLFYTIANCENENLKLTKLVLFQNDLSSVPPDVLARAVSRLETVSLAETRLTPVQVIVIFTLVAERGSSTLRKVTLDRSDAVPADLRKRAEENSSVHLREI